MLYRTRCSVKLFDRENNMPKVNFPEELTLLRDHIKYIKNALKGLPIYTEELSSQPPQSLSECLLEAEMARNNLVWTGAAKPIISERNALRLEASAPLIKSLENLINRLDIAKQKPDNPIPKRTWEEFFSLPLKRLANKFLPAEKQYPISTKDSKSDIKDTAARMRAELNAYRAQKKEPPLEPPPNKKPSGSTPR